MTEIPPPEPERSFESQVGFPLPSAPKAPPDPPPIPRRTRLRGVWLFLRDWLPLLLILVGAEVLCRIQDWGPRGWELNPGSWEMVVYDRAAGHRYLPKAEFQYPGLPEVMRINARGLRNDFNWGKDRPRRPDELRVVVAGDSNTYVAGFKPYSDWIWEYLRILLPERDVTVYNLGVASYSTFDVANLLRVEAELIEPDYITVYAGTNDLTRAHETDLTKKDIPAIRRWLRVAASKSRFLMLLRQWNARITNTLKPKPPETGVEPEPEEGWRRRVEDDEAPVLWNRLQALAAVHGGKLILTAVPWRIYETGPLDPHGVLTRRPSIKPRNEQMRTHAAERGVPYVDLQAFYDTHNHPHERFFYTAPEAIDLWHHNEKGQAYNGLFYALTVYLMETGPDADLKRMEAALAVANEAGGGEFTLEEILSYIRFSSPPEAPAGG